MNLHIIPVCLYLFTAGIFGAVIFGIAALAAGFGGMRFAGLYYLMSWVSVIAVVFSLSVQIGAWVHAG